MASEPVSPMKIRAGAAFHHRKPRQAPASATDGERQVEGRRSRGRASSGGTASSRSRPGTAKQKVAEPEARPSSPSVRFTALAVPTMITTAHTIQPTWPRSMPSEFHRVNDRWVFTPAQCSASRAKRDARSTTWAASLARLLSPRLRRWRTLIQSSTNPTHGRRTP